MQRIQPYLLAAIVAFGAGGSAKAAITYAYAEQTVTGFTVTGTGLVGGTTTGTATTASAAVDGSGTATNAPFDTLQVYQGFAPASPQNSFVKYSSFGGGPQANDFTRGDGLLTNSSNLFTSGASASTVAESANSGAFGLMTGTSNFIISGSFTTTGSSVLVSYNYANDIVSLAAASSSAESKFTFLITIKDQHGHTIDASPADLNSTIAAPPNSPEIITSGSSSATLSLAGLTAGDTLSITLSGQSATTAINPSAVPEPDTASLFGCGLGLLLLASISRRNKAKKSDYDLTFRQQNLPQCFSRK